MKIAFLSLLMTLSLVAYEHHAKLEPYERVIVKAGASGLVVDANRSLEARVLNKHPFLRLDEYLDQVKLQNEIKTLKLLEEMIALNTKTLSFLKDASQRSFQNYRALKGLSSVSQKQKDDAYRSFTALQTQYLGEKQKNLSLKQQIIQVKNSIAFLEDTIQKKRFKRPGWYLEELMVQVGDFVSVGTPVARLSDLSKGRVTLYLSEQEAKDAKSMRIYIDGEPTSLNISKVWRVNDPQNLSSYKAEIIIPNPKYPFSKLLRVEFRDDED